MRAIRPCAVLLLSLAAVLVIATGAHAQTTAAPAAPLPECWPAQVPTGTGSKAVRVTSNYGQAIMWWCGEEAVGIVSSWTYALKIPEKLPTNLVALLSALWLENVTSDPIDATERAHLRQDALIALQPLRPAPTRWLVAANGTATTRPVYALAAGALSPTSLRATVGAVCDCASAKHAPGSVTYCRIPTAGLSPASAIPSVPVPVSVCRLS